MSYPLDRQYLERRYRESVRRAQEVSDPALAGIHREFAKRYARALRDLPEEPQREMKLAS